MFNRARVRPSKGASAMGMLMGGAFVLIGIFFIIPQIRQFGGPIWFGILWTIIALFITIFNGINTFSNRGIANLEVQLDENPIMKSSTERIRELEQLKNDGLISDIEFQEKRKEIISRI